MCGPKGPGISRREIGSRPKTLCGREWRGGGGWIYSGTYMLSLQYQLVKGTLLIRSNSIYFNELECNQKSFEH